MKVTDRFLKYTTFDTQSCDKSQTTPSTPGQRVFAGYLVEELKSIGLQDVLIDDNAYIMATLPANVPQSDTPVIGFIAHLDTSPDMPGKNVKAHIVDYSGGDIVLNQAMNIVLSPRTFPERRYNQVPLLRSNPGGFQGSWPYRTYPAAKIIISFYKSKKIHNPDRDSRLVESVVSFLKNVMGICHGDGGIMSRGRRN